MLEEVVLIGFGIDVIFFGGGGGERRRGRGLKQGFSTLL